jgi:indolepyruvate ferredoxin oxidoreductase alpha subunit
MLNTEAAGCAALAGPLAGAVGLYFAVTGQPVTHLIDLLGPAAARLELSVNEKSAIEAAVGASAVGVRTCVVVKHCGLAYALDSLANAAVHGIGAALLIVSGDDCDAAASTVVFDSRTLAEAARTPVVDLAPSSDTAAVVAAAVRLSESAGVPVVLRVTAGLHAACAGPTGAALPASVTRLEPNAARVDREAAHRLTKLGRHQRHRQDVVPRAAAVFGAPPLLVAACTEPCTDAVIVSGAAARHLPDGAYCRLMIQGVWPLPAAVRDFVRRHGWVLVAEEPSPYLESLLGPGVSGRLDGRLPPEGALSAKLVAAALATAGPRPWTTVARKSAGSPDQPPFDALFAAVARLGLAGTFVAADVGSSVRLCYPPYDAATVALSLGSAIGVAGGAARLGDPTIAVLGDYALTHSGLEALLDCAAHHLPVLALVLANRAQAQTGGQDVPPADRAALARACGAAVDEFTAVDPDTVYDRLRHLLEGPLPAVAFVNAG